MLTTQLVMPAARQASAAWYAFHPAARYSAAAASGSAACNRKQCLVLCVVQQAVGRCCTVIHWLGWLC